MGPLALLTRGSALGVERVRVVLVRVGGVAAHACQVNEEIDVAWLSFIGAASMLLSSGKRPPTYDYFQYRV